MHSVQRPSSHCEHQTSDGLEIKKTAQENEMLIGKSI
jgi:hypothetical protein